MPFEGPTTASNRHEQETVIPPAQRVIATKIHQYKEFLAERQECPVQTRDRLWNGVESPSKSGLDL